MPKKEITPEVAQELVEFESKPVIAMTLIYVLRGDEVLLLERAGDREMVPGKVLGLGGKVESNESIVEAAKREVYEEAGIDLENLELRGTLTWVSEKQRVSQIFIFVGWVEKGTEEWGDVGEGTLKWHKIDEVLGLKELADHQRIFLPIVLEGKDFYAGMAAYYNGELLRYADNKDYLNGRREK